MLGTVRELMKIKENYQSRAYFPRRTIQRPTPNNRGVDWKRKRTWEEEVFLAKEHTVLDSHGQTHIIYDSVR